MKIAIIGSRTFNDFNLFTLLINKLNLNFTQIITGGAKGTDSLAEKYANENKIKLLIIKPEYDKYHFKKAPLMRNKEIVSKCNMVIAFWNGTSTGTLFTINEAKKQNIPVKIIYI
jgi:phosphoserine aminotransferase